MDNELLLFDRIEKIKQIISKYGEDNFYISFSGGKDSTVVSWLVDKAFPDNQIPRVFADTGIELNMIRDFVMKCAKKDKRIVIIKPSHPIKKTLEEVGYPFKSKEHSAIVENYQRHGEKTKWVRRYLGERHDGYEGRYSCPKKLRYQFEPGFDIKISAKCCDELKKKPLREYEKRSKRPYKILGLMQSEGGRRSTTKCVAFQNKKFKSFHPLAVVTKEWEDWLIDKYNIEICDIYKPPYNFDRTGCKGCPYNVHIQESLDTMEKYFPNEKKQCEIIWKPIYDEYRRINYRLKSKEKDKER